MLLGKTPPSSAVNNSGLQSRALAAKPNVLLADEPTGALDTETSYQVMDLLTGLNQEGLTIVVVTHESDIAEMTQRTVRLRDGSFQTHTFNPNISSDGESMNILDTLRKWTTLSRSLRTMLTALSVAWGIFMLVILLAAGDGVIGAMNFAMMR